MQINQMNDRCGECELIDWCGEPYEYPHLCCESRFDDVENDKYIEYAETSNRKSKIAISNDVYKRMIKDGVIDAKGN